MHAMRTIAMDDPVARASVSLLVFQTVMRATVLTHSPDGATSMQPLIHYCSHFI